MEGISNSCCHSDKQSKASSSAIDLGTVTKGSIYRCPMDPEIEQATPGSCPKCGMALEPMFDFNTAINASFENPELKDMRSRFWLGLSFTVPVFFISMGRMMALPFPWEMLTETGWH